MDGVGRPTPSWVPSLRRLRAEGHWHGDRGVSAAAHALPWLRPLNRRDYSMRACVEGLPLPWGCERKGGSRWPEGWANSLVTGRMGAPHDILAMLAEVRRPAAEGAPWSSSYLCFCSWPARR